MELAITQIGNSKGVRIPQTLLKQCGFGDSVTVEVKNNQLILSPTPSRIGWEKQFARAGRDANVVMEISHTWDEEEWQW